ncbi:CAMK family protein kinase [Tritrichomonas foetus]|uniref:CAMK family protein kinase n=1 Tax=Tritrichomonas foetus TaxID=1144522 RepID=A0A1J4L0V0_9EUKA|nr:CAMK family protein kinase [Tritrichomonas foetus]|eukprot:OHT17145.1 CAMK family protein kinase [Tritrichomonas foetus]
MRNLTTSVMTVRNMKNRIFFNMVLNSFGHNRFETSMSLTPKTLGNYTIIGTLGTGTSAKVKLAEHIETHRKVALKILKKNNLESKPEFFSKIQQEISLMSLFDHPHIIRLYEVFESEKHLFLALEYCENGDLFDFLIQGQKLSEEEAMNYFRQLIYALEYLHLHEICHRDLKPENLLLDSHNSLKIGDFGFALWMRDKDSTKSCGSPHYAAPEIIQGRAYSGKKVDIWSAGVILYAMITVCFLMKFGKIEK